MHGYTRYSLDLLAQNYSRGQLQFHHLDLRNVSLEGIKLPFVEFIAATSQG